MIRFAMSKLLPKMTAGEAALRFVPDLISAGLTASSLPQGVDPGMRGLVALEDLGIGVGASLLGGFAGRRGAQLINRKFGKNLDAGQIATVADMATTMPAAMLLPRPGYGAAIEQAYGIEDFIAKERQQQEAQQQFEQQKMDEQLLFGGLGAGYGLANYGLGLGGRMI